MDTNTFWALKERLKIEEGFDEVPRWDRAGATIGHGHQVPMSQEDFDLLFGGMDETKADRQLGADIWERVDELASRIPWFGALDAVRQAALVEMAFNMGVADLLRFHRTLGALRTWTETKDPRYLEIAHEEALDSDWGRDPDQGVRARAREVAEMLRTGEWPGGLP